RFFASRQPRALEIQDVHSERGGARGDLAADFSKPDDAYRAAVQAACSRNASPIAARHMSAVERLVRQVRSRKPLDAGKPVEAMDASREREHQREGVLRAGDVGPPAHAEDLDAGSGAGRDVDVSKHGAVFVNDLESGRA